MASDRLSQNPAVARIVERQMRNWELARSQRMLPPQAENRQPVEDFLTISRAVGAGGAEGAEIANRIGEQLGWPVFNKEILHAMADDDRIRTQIYHSMDERDIGWFEDTLRSLMQGEFKKNDYFPRLTHTVLALARQGHAVFRGRAADLVLPRSLGLRVRLTASREGCIAAYTEHHNLAPDQARQEVEQIEGERADFVRRHFKIDPAEQSRFDLVINLESFSAAQAQAMVLSALKMRGVIE